MSDSFFFSSRRRHTRCSRDWSSDVCSSDLWLKIPAEQIAETQRLIFNQRLDAAVTGVLTAMILVLIVQALSQWYSILSRGTKPELHESPYAATRWAADYSGAAHGDDCCTMPQDPHPAACYASGAAF